MDAPKGALEAVATNDEVELELWLSSTFICGCGVSLCPKKAQDRSKIFGVCKLDLEDGKGDSNDPAFSGLCEGELEWR